MATIDSDNMQRRLRALLPPGWFAQRARLRDVVLGGIADCLAWAYSTLMIAKAGTRRAGTTGWLLDIDAFGFFGSRVLRRPHETDDAWRRRYTNEIFRPRVTRAAIDSALYDLTGRHPIIIEAANPNDTSAYSANAWYGTTGIYGSVLCPYAVFITAFRPSGSGIPNIAGYGYGYYGAGTTAIVSLSQVECPLRDADIYDEVAMTVGAGVVGWTDIQS